MTQTEDLMNVAVQAAHDIRSPLAALTIIEQDLSALPEETRALLKAAISRIKEIAKELLDRTRGDTPGAARARTSVAPMITALVDEKRVQHRWVGGLELRVELPLSDLCVQIWPADFRRAVSNLIDNAIEACESAGQVTVGVSGSSGKVWIKIRDDGRGMSSDVLSQAGRRGFSSGKRDGNGLGLASARSVVEACGGVLLLDSVEGQGTTVTLQLPEAALSSLSS